MKKRVTCLILSGLMLLGSGCGTKAPLEVPTLAEPAAVIETYRPVEYGDVGYSFTMLGYVVPTQHCYYWEEGACIQEIRVNVGDFVHEGDILAVADTEYTAAQITELKGQIALENQQWELEEEIYRDSHAQLEFESTFAWAGGQTTVTDAIAKQLSTMEENHRFDTMLHNFQIEELQKQIRNLQKIMDNAYLIADTDGYVSYIQDLSQEYMAYSGVNVVRVADYEERYIHPPVCSENSKTVADFYGVIDGVEKKLIEIPYTPEEYAAADSFGFSPDLRLVPEDGSELPPVGTCLTVTESKNCVKNVLVVGYDSVNTDSQGFYVYVKDGEQKQMRRVTLGAKDQDWVQVLDGLKEGEWVYYTNHVAPPSEYDLYTVERNDYDVYWGVNSFKHLAQVKECGRAPQDGIVEMADLVYGTEVHKGDLICQISTDVGAASLTEMRNSLLALQEQIDAEQTSYEKEKEELEKTMKEYVEMMFEEKNMVMASEEIDEEQIREAFERLETRYGYMQSALELQGKQIENEHKKAQLQFSYDKKQLEKELKETTKNNNGKGLISIYAQSDGILNQYWVKTGQKISEGDYLYLLTKTSDEMIEFRSGGSLYPGQKLLFTHKETEEEIEAIVTGVKTSGSAFFHMSGDHVQVAVDCGTVDERGLTYYVKCEDEKAGEIITDDYYLDIPAYSMQNVCQIPLGNVKKEKLVYDTHYFVWRVIEGKLVKHYVDYEDLQYYFNPMETVFGGLKPGDVIAVIKKSSDEKVNDWIPEVHGDADFYSPKG